jgi:hypothetical protein
LDPLGGASRESHLSRRWRVRAAGLVGRHRPSQPKMPGQDSRRLGSGSTSVTVSGDRGGSVNLLLPTQC